jgi:hypothetical protein
MSNVEAPSGSAGQAATTVTSSTTPPDDSSADPEAAPPADAGEALPEPANDNEPADPLHATGTE